jgi:polysaccharide export outer membrane protein
MSKPNFVVMILIMSLCSVTVVGQRSNAGRHLSARTAGNSAQVSVSGTAKPDSYVIGADDVLDVSVWQEPNVSRSVPVRPDGKISVPLVNDIQAAGLTPMQLAVSLTQTLARFLNNPQVTVTVTAINSQRVYLVGEVSRPGPVLLLPNMRALQAISTAGGVTPFADRKHAYVSRHEGERDVTYPLNYRDFLRGDMRGNIVLKTGDTIVVP